MKLNGITNTPIQPQTSAAHSIRSQAFGSGLPRPDMFLKIFDFVVPWESTVPHNKLCYANVISSRILGARTNNERREVLMQDPLGWFFWFFGNPLMQTGLILFAAKKVLQPLLYHQLPQPEGGLKKLMWMFDPTQRFKLTTDVQLEQRQAQILKAMATQKVNPQVMGKTQDLFKKALSQRHLISFIGLMFTFAALGLGITWFKIAVTQAAVARKRQQEQNSYLKPIQARFSSTQHAQRLPYIQSTPAYFSQNSGYYKPQR
jgi:hypothetical protein